MWLDPAARTTYVLEADRAKPEAEQIKFTIGPMKHGEYLQFASAVRTEDGQMKSWLVFTGWALRFGLKGWSGGNAPQFVLGDDGYPTDETLSRLPIEWRMEIGLAAEALNHLKEEQQGK